MKELIAVLLGIIATLVTNEYYKRHENEKFNNNKFMYLSIEFVIIFFIIYMLMSTFEEQQLYNNMKTGDPTF